MSIIRLPSREAEEADGYVSLKLREEVEARVIMESH